jgi:hypothetical protein
VATDNEELIYRIRAVAENMGAFRQAAKASDDVNKSMKEATALADKLTNANKKLSLARDREQDTIGKVRVAEQKLSEVREKSGAKMSQIAAAEENLAKARRTASRAAQDAKKVEEEFRKVASMALGNRAKSRKAGEDSGRSWFGGFMNFLASKVAKIGGPISEIFTGGLAAALKTPVIGPIIGGVLLAAITSAVTPLGAIVAGALVSGFGAGLATLGAVFAAKSAVVKKVWADTVSSISSQMAVIAKPFESTLISMAAVAQRTFAGLKPALTKSLATLGPAVTHFGDDLGKAFGQLGPSLQPVSEAFSRILASLGPAMIDLFSDLSNSFIKLSESIKKNPTALADFIRGVGGLTSDLTSFITDLNNVDESFKRLTHGTSTVTVLMGALRGAVGTVTGPVDLLALGFGKLADGTRWAIDRQFPGQAKDAADKTTALSKAVTQAAAAHAAHAAATLHSATATHAANAAALLAAGAYDRQRAATDKLITSLNRMSSLSLTLSGAQIGMAQSVADASAAVKANGRTLDLNTQKGRDNRTALNQVAQAANDQRDAMLRAGKGTDAATAATVKSKAEFIRIATQMGLSKTAAKKLADQMIATPNVTRKVSVDTTAANRKVAAAQAAIDHMHGKIIPITYTVDGVNFTLNTKEPTHAGRARGGPIHGPGSGTSDTAGLFALSNNEYVVKSASARKYGPSAMESVNQGTAAIIPGLAKGGYPSSINIHGYNVFKNEAQLRKILGQSLPATSAPGAGAGVQRWRNVALAALAAAHEPASWIGSLLSRMQRESGGNPRAINLWDSNAKRGTPSIGLMQTIGPTFSAYAGPYRGRGIYDPFANIYAAIKYTVARYGSGPAGWNKAGGYKNGGWLMPGQTAYNETRKPEAVFNQHQLGSMGLQKLELLLKSDGSPYMEFLIREIRKYVRVNGGDVQKVLGARG